MRSTGHASLDWSGRPSGGGSNNVHTIRAMCAHAYRTDTWPVRYEIIVRGLLSETLLAAFPTLSAKAHGAEAFLPMLLSPVRSVRTLEDAERNLGLTQDELVAHV
jgi:hypothetical protein